MANNILCEIRKTIPLKEKLILVALHYLSKYPIEKRVYKKTKGLATLGVRGSCRGGKKINLKNA